MEPLISARPPVIILPAPGEQMPPQPQQPVIRARYDDSLCNINWIIQLITCVVFFVLLALHLLTSKHTDHYKTPVLPNVPINANDLNTINKINELNGFHDTMEHELMNRIHARIARRAPDTTSFSLGRDSKTGLFRNVIMDANSGELLMKDNEINPIGLTSEYIDLKEHGTVIPDDKNNAYRISGMGEIVFKCPSGFSGHECHLTQYCNTVEDVGKYKPVTMQLFNMLNLNVNARNRQRMRAIKDGGDGSGDRSNDIDNSISLFDSNDDDNNDVVDADKVAELIHPRIRMHCLTTNGGYLLETCPSDKLLDINLNCVPYDTCSDRLAGSRHTQQLDPSNPLGRDEYYICEGSKSVRKQCSAGNVFDSEMGGCVSDSRCFNMGRSTFPINSTTYLQCAYDEGITVDCAATGSRVYYDPNTRRHSCRALTSTGPPTCVPRLFERESDSVLKYTYGQLFCDPEERLVICDTTPEPERYVFTWAEKFEYVFQLWPRQVLTKDGKCTDSPPLTIVHKPVMLRFSRAMYAEHPFDFPTMSYICDDARARYRWDYIQNVVYDIQKPERGPLRITNDFLVSTAAPCQWDAQDLTIMPPHFNTSFLHPPVNEMPFIFISVPVYLPKSLRDIIRQSSGLPEMDTSTFWPIYIPDVGYVVSQCLYTGPDETAQIDPKTLVIRTERNTKTPPIGFEFASSDASATVTVPTQLELIGYPNATKTSQNQHYYIASGQLMGAQFAKTEGDYALLNEYMVPIERQVITTNQNPDNVRYFTFNWSRIIDTITIMPGLQIKPTAVSIFGKDYPRGFLVCSLTVQPGSDSEMLVLDIGGLDEIIFIAEDFPQLFF